MKGMNTARSSPPFRLKPWLITVLVALFLLFWLNGMTAGLMAGACRNDRYEGAKKLRFCNISLTVGGWMDAFPLE